MACSLSLVPLASFACWRGRSTAGPSHYPTFAACRKRGKAPFGGFAIVARCGDDHCGFLSIAATDLAGIAARVFQRIIATRAGAPTVKFTYTSPFQYSLTSYLRTSSTQV